MFSFHFAVLVIVIMLFILKELISQLRTEINATNIRVSEQLQTTIVTSSINSYIEGVHTIQIQFFEWFRTQVSTIAQKLN